MGIIDTYAHERRCSAYEFADDEQCNCTPYVLRNGRAVAADRDEEMRCEAGTLGCCVLHSEDDGPCETW